jgi:hypothetical protein
MELQSPSNQPDPFSQQSSQQLSDLVVAHWCYLGWASDRCEAHSWL